MRLCLLTFVMTCFFTSVNAQVVETGRWQELNFSAAEVHHSTEKRYRQMLADLAATNQLATVLVGTMPPSRSVNY